MQIAAGKKAAGAVWGKIGVGSGPTQEWFRGGRGKLVAEANVHQDPTPLFPA